MFLIANLAHGPVVLLVGAHSDLTETLLPRFMTASLVATPARLGGPPFRIYVLSSVSSLSLWKIRLLPICNWRHSIFYISIYTFSAYSLAIFAFPAIC